MALKYDTIQKLKVALADEPAANDLVAVIAAAVGVGAVTPQAGVAAVTVTATTGTLPTAASSQVIANATTGATVAELLALCVSLNAKIAALDLALKTAGVLTS